MLDAAARHLATTDPVLCPLIERFGAMELAPRGGHFAALCRSIIGQQVSVASAAAIFGRFEAATGLDPASVASLSEDDTRTIGLSRQKAGYLHDLATHFAGRPDVYTHLADAPDEQVITELTAIKGIGVWTAQMFMMFTLGRPDVFAPDDLGLKNAIVKLYGVDPATKPRELAAFAERWSPYRTAASWYLWRSLDNVPVSPE